MPIPKYNKIMLPLLELYADKKNHSTEELYNHIYHFFKLPDEEVNELLASGRQTIINNRVGWAKTYLTKACLLKKTAKALSVITERGLQVLKENPDEISREYLKKFPEFKDFIKSKKDKIEPPPDGGTTPIDKIEDSYSELRENLANELLDIVKKSSPEFFENLVIDLLLKMGYGGSRIDAAKALGKVGDEGVDGVIKEDKLGLDQIYIQAKRWTSNSVGRPDIQKFVGALEGQKANKGIFITTSSFPPSVTEYVSKINLKVVLIDGETLVNYMIENDIGATLESSYSLKKIDTDYFDE